MFREIFLFDLKRNFRKPQTYIFFGLFFVMMMLVGMLMAGVFDTAVTDSNVAVNSANAVAGIVVGLNDDIMGLATSVILVAIMATGIQKDYEYNTHPLYFTKPITKASYFFGRFFSSYVTALFVFSAQLIGYYLGCLAGMGKPVMGPFSAVNFLEPFAVFVIPNVLLLGIIFFSITTFLRSTLPAYIACIVLLVLNFVTSSVGQNLDNLKWAAIAEPFGMKALNYVTRYWTPEEQNTRLIPLTGVLLANRLLWLGIAVGITVFSYARFSFSQFLSPVKWFKKKTEANVFAAETQDVQPLASLPVAKQVFGAAAIRKQLFYLSGFEFKKIAKGSFFVIVVLLGIITMYIMAQYMGSMYDTETYPVTHLILEVPAGFFQLFIMIFLVFMSGNLVWREREQKTDELIGTTPVGNGVLLFSKYIGLVMGVVLLLLLLCIVGMLIQVSMGFYHVEPMLYLKFLGRMLLSYTIMAGLCMAVQVFVPNKYLGFFMALLPILFVNIVFGLLEWDNQLYWFNSGGPAMPYSDMNGYGHVLGTWFLYKGYWLAIVLVLCLLSLKCYPRGKEKTLKARLRLSRGAATVQYKIVLAVCLLFALGAGAYIFYNTNILHQNKTPKEGELEQVAFEKNFKHFEKTPQPRIVAADINVDLYPTKRNVYIAGKYTLKNKRTVAIDTLFVNYMGGGNVDYTYAKLQPAVACRTLMDDKKYGVKVLLLQQPLRPGDSIDFDFEIRFQPIGFRNGSTETDVVYNGTFFSNGIFPSIGYNEAAELGENTARKKYGLKPKPRMAAVNDSAARMNTYISNDADWIRYRTTVSTDPDQIAVAPGYLQKEWQANGRRYFSYQMDSPILNFYSYLSARYSVKKDKWKNVNIEVYYQEGHEYNLDRMINSIKQSLDYYTANFGPYQHRQVRILEFPRYASFAQSFPNTIPFSENIGFITKVDSTDPYKIDVPFYVTAHEVAHQWWAHQVIGGNVQGCVVMSETMSQYSALMVMEKRYGKAAMKKFLRYEMDMYLRGRTMEGKKEVPLMLCENQDYIHYRKGSVIMYSLRDYLGEAVLNKALSNYLNKVKFQEPPYTNSVEFVDAIKAATPDSLRYIIKDMFETITLYENYVKDLSYTKTAEGKYKVTLTVGSAKFRSDSIGKQTKIPVADYIDIGIFGAKAAHKHIMPGKELVLEKVKMDKPEKTFTFMVNEQPVTAGIDPYNKLIDRNPDNNTWIFGTTKPPKVNTDPEGKNRPGNITVSVGG
ncbi:MAG: M1 family aminopeptidase [Edaphocola sp.]